MSTDDGPQEPGQIAELFERAGLEDEAIRALRAGFADLLKVHDAKQSIKALTPTEVRAFIEYRRTDLGEPTS